MLKLYFQSLASLDVLLELAVALDELLRRELHRSLEHGPIAIGLFVRRVDRTNELGEFCRNLAATEGLRQLTRQQLVHQSLETW